MCQKNAHGRTRNERNRVVTKPRCERARFRARREAKAGGSLERLSTYLGVRELAHGLTLAGVHERAHLCARSGVQSGGAVVSGGESEERAGQISHEHRRSSLG